MTSRKHEGFRVTKRTAIIDFAEGHDYHGLEVRVVISIPFETLFWFQSASSSAAEEFTKEAVFKLGEEYVLDWNMEDEEGRPIPVSGASLLNLGDFALVTALLEKWIQAVAEPSAPLSETSNDSGTLEEPMMNELASASTLPQD